MILEIASQQDLVIKKSGVISKLWAALKEHPSCGMQLDCEQILQQV